MAYRRQTRGPGGLSTRNVRDESKQLYAESKLASAEEKKFISDDEKSGVKYAKSLEWWKKYLDKHGPEAEQVKFWTTNVQTAKDAANALPKAFVAIEKHQIDSARRDWNEMDPDKKASIKEETANIIRNSDGIDWKTTNLANVLKEKGFTGYSNFIKGRSSTYQTAIMLDLAEEAVTSFGPNLKGSLADNSSDYWFYNVATGKREKFFAADIFEDPETSGAKLRAYIDQHKNDILSLATSGNVKTDIINSLIGDQLNTVGSKFETTQLLMESDRLSKDTLVGMGNDLSKALSLSTLPVGENLVLSKEDATNFSGKIENFLRLAEAEFGSQSNGGSDAKEKARNLLRSTLRNWALKQKDPNAAFNFLNDITNGRIAAYESGDLKDIIKLRDSKGKPVGTLADLDRDRFGDLRTAFGQQEAIPSGSALGQDFSQLHFDLGFAPALFEGKGGKMEPLDLTKKENQLYVNGKLNPAWSNTWQYEMAEKYLNQGNPIPQEEVDKALEKLWNAGAWDVDLVNKIRYSSRTYSSKQLTTSALATHFKDKTGIFNSEILVKLPDGSYQISSEHINDTAWNREALNTFFEDKKIEIVDSPYGSSDGGAAVQALESKITSIVVGPNGVLTPAKEALIKKTLTKFQEAVFNQENPNAAGAEVIANLPPQHERIEALMNDTSEGSILSQLTANINNPASDDYIDRTTDKMPNQKEFSTGIDGWFGWGPGIRKRNLLQNNASQRQLTQFLRGENTDGVTASTEQQFLTKDQLERIVTGASNKHQRTNVVTYTGHLPDYVIKMAMEAGEDPWDFVNNQRLRLDKNAVPLEKPKAVQELEANGFNTKKLNTIFRLQGSNISSKRPNNSLSFSINNLVNTMLREAGKTEMPHESSATQTFKRFEYSHQDTSIHGAANPQLGAYGILKSDAILVLGERFPGVNEFLASPALQEEAITGLVSRINNEAWDSVNIETTGRQSTPKPKNIAQVLRHMNNRITLGLNYKYDSIIPSGLNINDAELLFRGSKFLNNYRQNFYGAQQ